MEYVTPKNGYRIICLDSNYYTEEHVFTLNNYDENGAYIDSEEVPLTKLWQSVNTHYFTKPLSAIVKVCDDGEIHVVGSKTSWRYNIIAQNDNPATMPEISGGQFVLTHIRKGNQ